MTHRAETQAAYFIALTVWTCREIEVTHSEDLLLLFTTRIKSLFHNSNKMHLF